MRLETLGLLGDGCGSGSGRGSGRGRVYGGPLFMLSRVRWKWIELDDRVSTYPVLCRECYQIPRRCSCREEIF